MKIKLKYIFLFFPLTILLALNAGGQTAGTAVKSPGTIVGAVLLPVASGTQVNKNAKAEIDYSNAKDGYIMVRFLNKTTKALKVQITGPSKKNNTFNLKNDGSFETFSLTDGNGEYSITVFEQAEGTKFGQAHSAKISVNLANEFAPYLRPNQYINYNAESKTVLKAAELVKGLEDSIDKIEAIYGFIVKTFTYDDPKAATVKAGYVPDVDLILKEEKGICFDYTAVTAAMLRSVGVPTKMVHGSSGDGPHAWLDIYADKTGWVSKAFQFDGKNWKLMDPTFDSSGGQGEKVRKYINDTKNYTPKNYY